MADETHINNEDIDTTISPSTPLDAPIAALIQDARDNDMGFAYRVAAELDPGKGVKQIVHRVERVINPYDDTEPPAPYRQHKIENAGSLVALAKKYSSAEKGLVLYNDTAVHLVLDEKIERGARELMTLQFAYSAEWHAWNRVLNTVEGLEHRTLLTHFLTNQHTLQDALIIDRMRKVKATFTANLESDLRLNEETVGVAYKAQAGNELIEFPRQFEVSLPVLDQDVDISDTWMSIDVRVEVKLPEQPNQPVRFQLLAPTLNAVRRERINEEIDLLRDGLAEWCIVRGTPTYVNRSVPGRVK